MLSHIRLFQRQALKEIQRGIRKNGFTGVCIWMTGIRAQRLRRLCLRLTNSLHGLTLRFRLVEATPFVSFRKLRRLVGLSASLALASIDLKMSVRVSASAVSLERR
jgi:hypothetical protein